MIERHHSSDGTDSTALYSGCGLYRYALTRRWNPAAPRLLWVMLNPSTASEAANDPTVERCERRARMMGYGAFRVCNLFAFRATDPQVLKAAAEPVGPENDRLLDEAAGWAGSILCGWGTHGSFLGRGAAVEAALRRSGRPLLHLGLTRDGAPRHPLYVSYGQRPAVWEPAPAGASGACPVP